jgi:hypothetical protein
MVIYRRAVTGLEHLPESATASPLPAAECALYRLPCAERPGNFLDRREVADGHVHTALTFEWLL